MSIVRSEGQVNELSLSSNNERFAPTPGVAGRDLGAVESHFLLRRPQRGWEERSVVSA